MSMSIVPCRMSNVWSPMSSWSWRSLQFPVCWSLTLKQLHLVFMYFSFKPFFMTKCYLFKCWRKSDTITCVGHLVDQTHVLLHGVHHVRQRVLLHWKYEIVRSFLHFVAILLLIPESDTSMSGYLAPLYAGNILFILGLTPEI